MNQTVMRMKQRKARQSRMLRAKIYARTADLSVSRLPADCAQEPEILHLALDAGEPALYAETVSIRPLSRRPPEDHLEDHQEKAEECVAGVTATDLQGSVSAAAEPEY